MDPYLEQMENSQEYLNDFLPAFLANSRYQDQLWSLPFQRSAVVMYYNADLLEEEGLSPPTDWESLSQAASELTVRSDGEVSRWGIEWPSGWPYWLFQPLALGSGQNIVGDGDTEVRFDDPDVIDAIEFYNSLSEEYDATPAGVQASWGNVVPNFVSGNTAMIVHSSGSLTNILDQADFEVGVMGIPGEDGGTYSVPGGGNLYLTAGHSEAEQQAAFDFAVFLTEPARAAEFSTLTGYIATRESAFETPVMQEYVAENPQAAQVLGVLTDAGKELAVQNLGQVRNIFHNYLQSAFNDEMEPAEAMAMAQSEADAALADFR
jgi:sn-glycerol 3-phosphate transport system substrate-binding protein